MQKTLGVFVSSDNHLEELINLCRAAKKKAVEVTVFFTHLGVMLTQDERFSELEGLANMSVCHASFQKYGLKPPVPGILEKDYATQTRHGMMIHDCDRYLVL